MGGNFYYGRKFIRRIELGPKAKILALSSELKHFPYT